MKVDKWLLICYQSFYAYCRKKATHFLLLVLTAPLQKGQIVPTHIVLIHDDPAFSDDLTACLRPKCQEVRVFDDLTITLPVPHVSNALELAIVRPAEAKGGLRIKVIGIPTGEPYTGPLIRYLVDPISVADVMDALTAFLG